MLRLIGGCSVLTLILGCSTPNSVQRIVDENSVIKYRTSEGNEHRFQNLYPAKKLAERQYPMTCERECYPDSPQLLCDLEGTNCEFIGDQQRPNLNTGFEVQWLGHASFHIITKDGTSLLFDPVSDQFDWPVGFAHWITGGIYRNKPTTWLSENELADVDGVMYSHNHYDHFSKADIDDMERDIEYFTPLGFAEHFEQDGYQLNEMAWFSSTQLNDVSIHFVPANHFGGRIWVPFIYEDFDTALWGGWIVEYQGKKLFFAGDTGYSQHFKDIQTRYGDMDICLMPIASYHHPEDGNWYRYVHVTPEDSLVAANDLNCKVMIPWGYGNNSWQMGDINSHSALLRMLTMHQKMKSNIPIYILNEGEALKL